MRTSFHHQPEAQHPNFPLSVSWQADYPIFWSKADIRSAGFSRARSRPICRSSKSRRSSWSLADFLLLGVPLPCAHATPSVPAVQLVARTLSPGVSDDVTLSRLRYTRVPDGKGLITLQYDERFKLGQVDGDDARR